MERVGKSERTFYMAKTYRLRKILAVPLGCDFFSNMEKFDVALIFGFLHHLQDDEVVSLCEKIKSVLRPGGRLLSLDPVITDDQSLLAKMMIRFDRGRHIRTVPEYRSLVGSTFPHVRAHVECDMLKFEYAHVTMECW